MEHRIYNTKEHIDSEKVHEFFEKRFIKDNPMASIMLRANSNDGVAEKRNENEMNALKELLDYSHPFKMLDIGCGLGRMAGNLESTIEYYDGIDFTKNYIDVANETYIDSSHIHFHNMSATEIDVSILPRKYNLVTITALMLYLNDEEIEMMLQKLGGFLKDKTQIYIRESISIIDQRLTLKGFHSEELDTDYNAIYRTQVEYETIFAQYLGALGFSIVAHDLLLKGELANRKETNQMYWLLERKGS